MVSVVDVPIELRHRIETFKLRIALQWWQVFDSRPNKTVLKRLHELQLVLNNRTAESNPRCKGSDAGERTATSTSSREEALGVYVEFIRSGFCLYRRYCPCELSILGRIRVGDDLN